LKRKKYRDSEDKCVLAVEKDFYGKLWWCWVLFFFNHDGSMGF